MPVHAGCMVAVGTAADRATAFFSEIGKRGEMRLRQIGGMMQFEAVQTVLQQLGEYPELCFRITGVVLADVREQQNAAGVAHLLESGEATENLGTFPGGQFVLQSFLKLHVGRLIREIAPCQPDFTQVPVIQDRRRMRRVASRQLGQYILPVERVAFFLKQAQKEPSVLFE